MSKNIKTASGFGGVGGGYQPSPFSPGNAPFGLSGKSRGGSGVNIYENEDPFNKILGYKKVKKNKKLIFFKNQQYVSMLKEA